MEKENNTIQDEEISLVDLFAVVIKYRKFIILGTILTILVFASFLFIVPKFKAPQKDIYNVEISVPILFEKNMSDLLGFNFASDVVLKFSDLNTIADLNKENTIFEYNFNIFNQLEYDDLIQKNVKNKKYIVNLNSSKTSINVNIKTHSMENAIGFINDFINKLNNDYSQLCIPIINEKLSVINDLIDKKNNDVSFNGLLNEKMNLQILNANINSMIGKDYKTFTTKEEINSNNLSKLFVVCFGGFIIFIFIAFLLNAIKNIKCDKISNEKIKNAWNEGKKLFP